MKWRFTIIWIHSFVHQLLDNGPQKGNLTYYQFLIILDFWPYYSSSLGGNPKLLASQMTWDPKLYMQAGIWGEIWGRLSSARVWQHGNKFWVWFLPGGLPGCGVGKIYSLESQRLPPKQDIYLYFAKLSARGPLSSEFKKIYSSKWDKITLIDSL